MPSLGPSYRVTGPIQRELRDVVPGWPGRLIGSNFPERRLWIACPICRLPVRVDLARKYYRVIRDLPTTLLQAIKTV